MVLDYILDYTEYLTEKKVDKLSGVLLICDDRILLVNPKKLKKNIDRWSIPKGHIEKELSKFNNALKELKEEAGVIIKDSLLKDSKDITIFYKKSDLIKELNVFIIRISLSDLNVKVDKDFNILRKFFNKKEIREASFFTKEEAFKIIEYGQLPLLKYL